jgi:hypothetical protein
MLGSRLRRVHVLRGGRLRIAVFCTLCVAVFPASVAKAASIAKSTSGPVVEPEVVTPAATADALPTPLLPGFNKYSFPANDDGSTAAVALPFPIHFFSGTYRSVYVNNNGNLTFGDPLSQYTPQGLGSLPYPIIAPFWGDVDTRVGNVVTYGSGTVEGHKAFGVTWPEVGCYSEIDSTTNTFQVVLISRSDIGSGDFEIEYNYGPIAWESGEASGGDASCLGGTPARAGYASGTGLSYELPGSGLGGALLSSNPTTGLSNQSYGSSEVGRDVFAVRSGQPVPAASAGYVALGDSYSAGEGDGDYGYGSGGAHNTCDRSPYAYGPSLANGLGLASFAFIACSGAVTDDFVAPNHEHNLNSISGRAEPAQLEALGPGTQAVSWTVGGNDIGFSEIAEACLYAKWSFIRVYGKPGCAKDTKLVSTVHTRLEALAGGAPANAPHNVPIKSILSLILEAHSRAPNARIYVAGYPRLFGSFSGECGVGTFLVYNLPGDLEETVSVKVASADAAWLDTLANELDAVISTAASEAAVITGAGVTYVDPNSMFETHRLCDSSNSWFFQVEGEVNYAKRSQNNVFRGSLHPTTEGQEDGYEEAFQLAGFGL